MKYFWLGCLLFLGFVLSWCSLSSQQNTLLTVNDQSKTYSPEEKLQIFTGMWDIILHCDPLRVGEEVCKQRKKNLSHQEKKLSLQYGDYVEFRGLEFAGATGSLLSFKVHTGAIEVEIVSLRNRTTGEWDEIKKKGTAFIMKEQDIESKSAYFTLRAGDERLVDMIEEYMNWSLHSKERIETRDWVGFDVFIRPLGFEATLDYKIAFKE